MGSESRFRTLALAAIIACICGVTSLPASAAALRGVTPQAVAGLGSATFPTSAKSDAAQTAFMRGLLLLHLFEYPSAAKAFEQAQTLQPDFAMAYWGEAMTYNHGIWNQLDADAGVAALAKFGATPAARAARAPTAREKAYLAAVEILYSGAGTKPERDARYCEAMRQLAEAYPQDDEAQLFYALALMGRNEGVRNGPDYLRAADIAERVFRHAPNNPGAAHYWIHGLDDPAHAAGALEAARALSGIAPDAGHAQHMTSHIFIALGMWDDMVAANVNAMRVVNAQARAAGKPEVECGHYDEWLEYGYYQQGRRQLAEQTLLACAHTIPSGVAWAAQHAAHGATDEASRRLQGSLATMRGTALIESGDWNGAASTLAVDASKLGPYAAWNTFVVGYAAAQRGDIVQAQQASADLHALRDKTAAPESDLQLPGYLTVMDDSLRGLVLIHRQQVNDGLAAIRQAAWRYDAMAFDFGPPVPIKPPHELLGEQLLAQGRAVEAQVQFKAALQRAPGRALALLGLGRAQAAAGDDAGARATFEALLKQWHAADADLPVRVEVQAWLDR